MSLRSPTDMIRRAKKVVSNIFLIAGIKGVCNLYVFDPADETTAAFTENESPEAVFDHLLYSDEKGFIIYSYATQAGDPRNIFVQNDDDYRNEYFHPPYMLPLTEGSDDNVPVFQPSPRSRNSGKNLASS